MRSADRIFLLLAAEDLDPSEIHHFFRSIERIGAHRATNHVLSLRDHSKEFLHSRQPRQSMARSIRRNETPKSIGNDVKRLLAETNLGSGEAAGLIARELRAMGVPPGSVPPFNKIGLSVWLDRVAGRFGAEKLMQSVSIILNKHLPSKIDWPLKREAPE